MQYRLTMTSDNPQDLIKLIGENPAAEVVQPTPIKPKPAKKPVEVEPEPEGDGDDDLAASAYSYEDDLLPAMQAYAKKHGREKALKVLKKYGAENSKQLKSEHYEAVMKIIA